MTRTRSAGQSPIMTTDLARSAATATITTAPPSPAEPDAPLYVSEEFAELLDSITSARARWDADTKGAWTREATSEPSSRPEQTAPALASWAPVPTVSRT